MQRVRASSQATGDRRRPQPPIRQLHRGEARQVQEGGKGARLEVMRKYRLVSKKGEGTFSEVLKAQNVKRGTYHAIKVSCISFRSVPWKIL